MAKLLDGLLDVSRITEGKLHTEMAPLDLREIVRECVADRAEGAARRGVALTVALPDRPLHLYGDATRLTQVFDNLIGNALRFTDRGEVAVEALAERGEARVVVKDSGRGFAPELVGRLFEPFRQGPQDLARSSGGLGLGLTLARGLVELHGGTVEGRISQLYYGERGAQVISSQLCTMVPDNEAAKFLSSQAMDEARHVEVFESLLTRIDHVYPMNPFLNALLTDMKRCDRLEEKLIGMNLLVEGLALSVFKFVVRLFEDDPRYQNEIGRQVYEAIKLILRDESRHVGFGVIYLQELLRDLPRRRVASFRRASSRGWVCCSGRCATTSATPRSSASRTWRSSRTS